MTKPAYAFLDSKQVADIGARALEVYDDMYSRIGWRSTPDLEARSAYGAAMAMLLACAECIAHLRDPALAPLALDIIERIDNTDHPYTSYAYMATAGLRGLLEAGVVTPELEACADHAHSHVRVAVAASLPVDTPERLQKMMTLGADEDQEVRATAKKRLTNVDVPFWMGKFSSDPFAGLSPKRAKAIKAPVETICKLFDEGYWDDAKQQSFVSAVKRLPPPLAADVLVRVEIGDYIRYDRKEIVASQLAKLADDGMRGLEAVLASPKVDTWKKSHFAEAFGKVLPPDVALRALPGLIERACAAPVDQAQMHSTAHCLAAVVGKGWPADTDPAPVLDAILARPRWEPYDPVASALDDALERSTCVSALLPRFEEALLKGFPDKWKELEYTCRRWLEKLPKPKLRAIATRALDCGIRSGVSWAVGVLLDEAYDAKRDPPAAELALRFDDDRRTREAMRLEHTERILPRLREELALGKLDFPVAGRVIVEIGNLYGGTFSTARVAWISARVDRSLDEKTLLSGNDGLRKLYAKFLGSKKGRAQASQAEWHAYRATRDKHAIEAETDWDYALRAIPYEEGWEPSDRALFDRAIVWLRERRTGGRHDLLAEAGALIVKKSDRADLPLLDELRAIAQDDPADDHDYEKETLRDMQNMMRARFGLPKLLPHAEAGDANEADTAAPEENDWLAEPS